MAPLLRLVIPLLAALPAAVALQGQRLPPAPPARVSPAPPDTAAAPIVSDREPLRKNPALAALLSAVFPGGGQMYNGQWRKAGFIWIGGAALGTAMLVILVDCIDWTDPNGCDAGGGAWTALGAAAVAGWGWTIYDAAASAGRINRERERRRGRTPTATVTLARIAF